MRRRDRPLGPVSAAIDCGSNTFKLLITDPSRPDGDLIRTAEVVRLGEGVDTTGRLAPAAVARALAAIDGFAALIAAHDVGRVRCCATSAVRDAADAAAFLDGVADRLGVRPEVLSGVEEARLAFAGATADLGSGEGPVLVVDVGGGSTELVLGCPGEPVASFTADVGAVRLTERHLRHDPPTAAELAALAADVDAALDDGCARSGLDPAAATAVIGVAGTALTLGALAADLPELDPAQLHGLEVPAADVAALAAALAQLTVAERRELPAMHPGRADVIVAGAVILERALARTRVTHLRLSVRDILDGLVLSSR